MAKIRHSFQIPAIFIVLAMVAALFPLSAEAVTNPLITTDTVDGLTVCVDYSTEKVYLQKNSSTDYTVLCDSTNGYYPFSFSLIVNERSLVAGKPAVSNGGSFNWAYDEATQQESTSTSYGLATLPVGSSSTVTVKTAKGSTITFRCAAPNGGTSASGSNVYAYLPAPGQFTNEGIGIGGWGDIYGSDGVLKNNTSTGVSLGSFGGYAVYKFQNPVANAPTDPYGADFIVYGNAFWGNSEPGCIQVSQDGQTWYHIAGSKYYDSDTDRNYSLTYTNPTLIDDQSNGTSSTLAPVNYTGSDNDKISTNPYHNHSWYPLNRNYFSARTVDGKNCPEMDKLDTLPGFGSYTWDGGTGVSSLTLKGVKLSNISTSNTAGIGFGYCDVHPNKALGGNSAYNPYQSFSSSSDYNTKVAGTSGGDPIDISWAVDGDGNPVNLSSIQYVRIYTGTAQMNGIFGEISTEVLGVAACTGTGSGEAMDSLRLKVNSRTVISHGSMTVTPTKYTSFKLTSSANHIYVNGVAMTSGTTLDYSNLRSGASQMLQIITQTGTEAPYITYLKVTKS